MSRSTAEMEEWLALRALGALTPEEAEEVDAHLSSDWAAARAESDELNAVADQLGLASEPYTAPAGLKDRVRARIDAEDARAERTEGFSYVAEAEGNWQEIMPGVRMKSLHRDRDTGRKTSLMELAAGTSLPPHRHLGSEELYCIRGECQVTADLTLQPGDYFRSEPGTWHRFTRSRDGALVLVISHGSEFPASS